MLEKQAELTLFLLQKGSRTAQKDGPARTGFLTIF
jgi:hypothetical protein